MLRRNRISSQPWMCVCVCVCVRERESVCVWEREKWWRWKERGCKCWSSMGKTLAITSSPSFIPPLNHHTPPPPLPLPLLSRQPRRAWRNGAFEAPNFDLVLKPETEKQKRIPANQDVTNCTKLFERSIVAVSINEIKKKLGGDFSKKAENNF